MIKCYKCHEEFEDGDSIMSCSRCGALYHKDCWFSEPTCMVKDCGNDRGIPLRGENLDPELTDDYIHELLEESNTPEYHRRKFYPIIFALILFILWIGLNSYHDYQKNHNKSNVTFVEKK